MMSKEDYNPLNPSGIFVPVPIELMHEFLGNAWKIVHKWVCVEGCPGVDSNRDGYGPLLNCPRCTLGIYAMAFTHMISETAEKLNVPLFTKDVLDKVEQILKENPDVWKIDNKPEWEAEEEEE